MLQNHMLQLVCLVAMEAPNPFEAEAIRDEKVKVINSIVLFDLNKLEDNIIRGQYAKGNYPAYRKKKG